MPLRRRRAYDPLTAPLEALEVDAQGPDTYDPLPEPQVGAEEPYVAPSVAAAMRGETVIMTIPEDEQGLEPEPAPGVYKTPAAEPDPEA